MATMNVQMIGLYVTDLDRCVDFYRALGIPLKVDAHGSYHHAEHSFHDPYFHFALFPKEAAREPALGLFVEDLDAAHERLVGMGAQVDRAPYVAPWGREARYLDPDGNLISITERKTHHTRVQ